jgi:signal transduction histidine kinase
VPPGAPSVGTAPQRAGHPFADLDWDTIQPIAIRWFQRLTDRDGWVAAGYLFVGMLSSIGFFTAVMAVGWTTFGLLFIGVGVFLIRPFFAMVAAFARAERQLAGWVGTPIEPRPVAPLTGLGFGALRDPERWRQVGFLCVNVVIAPILSGIGLAAYSLVPRMVFNDSGLVDLGWFGLTPLFWFIGLAIAVLLLGAAPRLAVFFAGFKAQVTGFFLGPSQLAEAQQRVSTLSTQRQDILDAVASERRRIERNLHDGVQQQLVAIGLDLGMAEQQLDRDPVRAKELIVSARGKVQGSIGELRQLGRGLHPAILEDRGIDAALSAVVGGSSIPVSVQVDPDLDLSTDVAETVYFVANEAIANVLKHAKARVASVHVTKVAANVRITVHDDGVGGIDPTKGTGIAGIRARVHAVDGSLTVSSPAGGPTTLVAEIPRHDRHHDLHHDRTDRHV